MHPSVDDSDFEDEDEEFTPFEGVTEEQAQALADAIVTGIEKIGLYAKHVHFATTEPDPFDDTHLMLHAVFTFGKVAFTPRVQTPERDETDEIFRQISHEFETESARDEVLKDFLR